MQEWHKIRPSPEQLQSQHTSVINLGSLIILTSVMKTKM